jgi:hypothetical protein
MKTAILKALAIFGMTASAGASFVFAECGDVTAVELTAAHDLSLIQYDFPDSPYFATISTPSASQCLFTVADGYAAAPLEIKKGEKFCFSSTDYPVLPKTMHFQMEGALHTAHEHRSVKIECQLKKDISPRGPFPGVAEILNPSFVK